MQGNDMSDILSNNKQRKVHLLHIGKTGGSAIKSVLRDCLETRRYSVKLHGHSTSIMDIPKGEYLIFFLRDPISRFVSAFYSRQRKGQPRYNKEWSLEEKEIFENFATPNQVAVSLANEHSINHALAIKAMASVQHFKPYSKWYIDFDYFKTRIDDILYIGFQESLDTDFSELKSILSISPDKLLPTDDLSAHRNPPNLDKSMDESGILALKYWYSDDYKFISLCKEIMSKKANYR
jgi:hypothetical protein